jgi:hypothetical protein
MNSNERKELTYFPKKLDEAVTKKFNVLCRSTYNFFSDRYVTVHEGKGLVKKNIEIFIDGFMAGNTELSERLNTLK